MRKLGLFTRLVDFIIGLCNSTRIIRLTDLVIDGTAEDFLINTKKVKNFNITVHKLTNEEDISKRYFCLDVSRDFNNLNQFIHNRFIPNLSWVVKPYLKKDKHYIITCFIPEIDIDILAECDDRMNRFTIPQCRIEIYPM